VREPTVASPGESEDARRTHEELVRQLKGERARLLAAQSVAGVGSWETDLATLEVTWSTETFRIFEIDAAGFQPTHGAFLDIVHPDDRDAVAAAFAGSVGSSVPQSIEHRIVMADDRVKFVAERWQTFFDERGKPLRAIGTCQDVSARRAAEQAIRVQAQMLDCIGQAVIATDLAGQVTYANRCAEELYGWGSGEMLGRDILDVTVPEATRAQATEIMARLRQGLSWSGEFLVRRRDGSSFPVSTATSPILDDHGDLTGIIGISSDISERIASAQALHDLAERTNRRERMLQTTLSSMRDFAYVLGVDGRFVFANRALLETWGMTLDDVVGRNLAELGYPEELARRLQREVAEVVESRVSVTGETRFVNAAGVEGYYDYIFSPTFGQDETVEFVVGTSRDVTERKRAEEALRASVEQFRALAEEYRPLFDGNPHAMWVFDAETLAFLAVNDAAVLLYGFSRDEFLAMTIKDIRPPEEVAALLDYVRTMPDVPSLPAVHVKHRRKDGTPIEVEGSTSPIQFHGRRARLVLARDVSEKRLLEAQLLQSQKMEAVGRLAGGVAHDFNNALGVILGYAELLLRHAAGPERRKLEQIVAAAQRAASLTRQLLAFSRKQVVEPKVVDLNVLVSDVEKMLGRLIGEDIDLAIVPAADLGQVRVDPGQMEQVVVNLCVNARDAMPDGGSLRIQTTNVERDAMNVAGHEPMAAGHYVMLSVTDDGCGIPGDILSKIYEPFFTTKEQGKGTGLGLSLVYGIVKQAGGHVWVESTVGVGTTFRICLPRVDEPPTPQILVDARLPARGWETILLVEDEGSLRAIAREILEGHGYQILDAGGASQAIEIARHHPAPIHLLVTDVVMPGMNGRVLAESLVTVRPDLRVLFMSGYTNDVIAHHGVLDSGTMFLEKPFSVAALLSRVRQALDHGVGPAHRIAPIGGLD